MSAVVLVIWFLSSGGFVRPGEERTRRTQHDCCLLRSTGLVQPRRQALEPARTIGGGSALVLLVLLAASRGER
ncbi:hypothetical protein [Paraoerskovia marina]|uniref:hypothetical protein n=1 Tax=Paraoerskovia marina TaxID=545619 RepID=UPI00049252F4|nr:hypothetical protein [Paraoerskovia marina]